MHVAEAKPLKRVLIADDASGARDLVCSCLRGFGYEMVEAEDGDQALSRVLEYKPDLVILDLQMPKRDGCSVAACLRKESLFRKTPILALSAWASETDPELLTSAGFTECLPKPFSPAKLRAIVNGLLSAQEG